MSGWSRTIGPLRMVSLGASASSMQDYVIARAIVKAAAAELNPQTADAVAQSAHVFDRDPPAVSGKRNRERTFGG